MDLMMFTGYNIFKTGEENVLNALSPYSGLESGRINIGPETRKMETKSFSEMLASTYEYTRRRNPEEWHCPHLDLVPNVFLNQNFNFILTYIYKNRIATYYTATLLS